MHIQEYSTCSYTDIPYAQWDQWGVLIPTENMISQKTNINVTVLLLFVAFSTSDFKFWEKNPWKRKSAWDKKAWFLPMDSWRTSWNNHRKCILAFHSRSEAWSPFRGLRPYPTFADTMPSWHLVPSLISTHPFINFSSIFCYALWNLLRHVSWLVIMNIHWSVSVPILFESGIRPFASRRRPGSIPKWVKCVN